MMMYLRALPRVWPSSRNSKEAAVGVEPGSCACHVRNSASPTCDSGAVAHTRNNLVSSSSSSSAAWSPFCDSCASSMTVSSPFSFDIFAVVMQSCPRMRSRASINVAVFFCEPVDQYAQVCLYHRATAVRLSRFCDKRLKLIAARRRGPSPTHIGPAVALPRIPRAMRPRPNPARNFISS